MGCFLFPREADPVPIVDAEAVLSSPVSLQCFHAIARRNEKIGERLGAIEGGKAAQCDRRDALELLDPFAIPQPLGFLTLKAPDHAVTVLE
jgi:hypothetical protein